MKRTFVSIGLLCCIAAPATAHAADALSPWVQQVIDRIDAGISAADSMGPNTCDPSKDSNYVTEAQGLIRDSIDTRQQISRQNGFLRENTVCYQSDLDLLDKKMDEIRAAIVTDVENCKLRSMRTLGEILSFATQAYAVLATTGNDPSVKSDLLKYEYYWESVDRLNSGSGTALTDTHQDALECPYTTDYAPHAIGYVLDETSGTSTAVTQDDLRSYGCDKDAISAIGDQTDEMSKTGDFIDATDTFAREISTMVSDFVTNLDTTIADLRGTTPTTSFPPPLANPPPHDTKTGCLRPQVPPVYLGPGTGAPDSMLDDYPDYYSEDNLHEVEIAPGVSIFSFNPPPDEALPIGSFLRPSYDYFSVLSDSISLQRRMSAKKTTLGNERPLPNYAQGQGVNKSMYLLIFGPDADNQFRDISASIDRQTGFLESTNRDAIERTMNGYLPLQAAITNISEVVDKEFPKYIEDFGYFMLRQCVNGHCSAVNGTLDTMEKRIYNPYCHAYISGNYTDRRMHIKCFCITKDEDPDDGLDAGSCDCNNPSGGDCETYCAYCQESPSQQEQDKYSSLEPELYPGCRVEHGDPNTGY